jgi:hypothetical protein
VITHHTIIPKVLLLVAEKFVQTIASIKHRILVSNEKRGVMMGIRYPLGVIYLWQPLLTVLPLLLRAIFPIFANDDRMSTIW